MRPTCKSAEIDKSVKRKEGRRNGEERTTGARHDKKKEVTIQTFTLIGVNNISSMAITVDDREKVEHQSYLAFLSRSPSYAGKSLKEKLSITLRCFAHLVLRLLRVRNSCG